MWVCVIGGGGGGRDARYLHSPYMEFKLAKVWGCPTEESAAPVSTIQWGLKVGVWHSGEGSEVAWLSLVRRSTMRRC